MNEIERVQGEKLPIVWNDIEFLQQTTKDMFYAVMSIFGIIDGEWVKISGCEISHADESFMATISPGFLSLNGEILKVDKHLVEDSQLQGTGYWFVDESYEAIGNKANPKGVMFNTYKVRKAKYSTNNIPSGYSIVTIQDKIKLMTNL